MTITPTTAEVILEAIESRLIDVHTSLPGRIESYDETTQTADIKIELKRMVEDEDSKFTTEELPKLPNVPICFPRSASFFISFPLASDDKVMVFFSESSLDQYRSKGSLTTPADGRRLSLTGAFAIPCNITNDEQLVEPHGTHMMIGCDEGQKITVKEGGTVEVSDNSVGTADDFVAMAGKVTTALDILGDLFTNWTPVATDGGAALKTAWGLVAASYNTAVESSNLKADD